MEYAKTEIEAVESTVTEAVARELRELSDFQLAYVGGGGGGGEVSLA
jgi:hypothetical protein